VIAADLSGLVTTPRIYQLEGVPRSASWAEVDRTLGGVDRSTRVGCRDYAILILLAYYGLRAVEVSMLRLSDLDWRNDVLRVRRAKRGGNDTLPLIPVVGNAVIDYLKVRARSEHPEVFLKELAPAGPISRPSVTWVARKYLLLAGVKAPHLGAHTLRHSHAVRLVRAGFSLKTIGGTLGHTCPQSTFIYSKVPTEELRGVGLDVTEIQR
jgi:integrase